MATMKISLIVAYAKNRVIGRDNQLPWRLPADLQYFKKMTLDKPIIMGRKNYQSIGRPLPRRRNIIISRNPNFTAEGCIVADSLDAALAECDDAPEVMIIGGAEIYQLTFEMADNLYITEVDAEIEGDTFFPDWEKSQWQEVSREAFPADEKNEFGFRFVRYCRISE